MYLIWRLLRIRGALFRTTEHPPRLDDIYCPEGSGDTTTLGPKAVKLKNLSPLSLGCEAALFSYLQ